MTCFWTDIEGCLEQCPEKVYGGTVVGESKLVVDIFSGNNGFAINAGDVRSSGAPSVLLTRIDFYPDTNDCGQGTGPAPAWFPSAYTGTVTVAGSPDPVVSASGMSLSIPMQAYSANGAPTTSDYIISMPELSAAIGGTDISADYHFVAYVELLVGGAFYYGYIVGNFCF